MVSTAEIDETIKLSSLKNSMYKAFIRKYFPDPIIDYTDFVKHNNTPEYQAYWEATRALDAYLASLDFEDIKDIQSVMYVGRDEESDSGMNCFFEVRKSLDYHGWNRKQIEINQMIEKAPLDTYLEKGKEIIGL